MKKGRPDLVWQHAPYDDHVQHGRLLLLVCMQISVKARTISQQYSSVAAAYYISKELYSRAARLRSSSASTSAAQFSTISFL